MTYPQAGLHKSVHGLFSAKSNVFLNLSLHLSGKNTNKNKNIITSVNHANFSFHNAIFIIYSLKYYIGPKHQYR